MTLLEMRGGVAMKATRFQFGVLAVAGVLLAFLSLPARAEDGYVAKAMSLTAHDFDETLPDEPIDRWLRAHLPAGYHLVWGDHMTDCGEGTGTAADRNRDMPMCLEAELREGKEIKGYLALFVGTEKRGLLKDQCGLYFGYLNHGGKKYTFKRLSEVLELR
jgi:hypothetical protein